MPNLLTVKDKVNRYTSALFGDDVRIDENGGLRIQIGSTMVFVDVHEKYSDKESIEFAQKFSLSITFIEVFAPVLVGLKPSLDLFKWVAIEGQQQTYGSFALIEAGDGSLNLIFQMNLAGDEIDQGELNNALMSIGFIADGKDEELQKIFGGSRLEDM